MEEKCLHVKSYVWSRGKDLASRRLRKPVGKSEEDSQQSSDLGKSDVAEVGLLETASSKERAIEQMTRSINAAQSY